MNNINITNIINNKIDLFMKSYLIGKFDLSRINWVFSISGGKDSFTMAKAIQLWYEKSGFTFCSTGLFIDQWKDNVKEYIYKEFSWLDDIIIIDAKHATNLLSTNNKSKQAPCRGCSDIRHEMTDIFLEKNKNNGMYNFVCRGLHLTDMAVSLLWRYIIGLDPYTSLNGKGKPIEHFFENSFLVKPLSFVREYESQIFSQQMGYNPIQCNCLALTYPSRRDIVEESALINYTNDLWEFDIIGVDQFLAGTLGIDKEIIKSYSLPGKEKKNRIICDDFFRDTIDYFTELYKSQKEKYKDYFDYSSCLDEIGANYLNGTEKKTLIGKIPVPKIIQGHKLDEVEMKMISTMGPLWGAIAYDYESQAKIRKIQQEIYGVVIDLAWGQTIDLLERYSEKNKINAFKN